MVIPMLIKKNIKADLAATGFSFFQTKYIINPTSGTQQSVIILTAQFGVSSPLAFLRGHHSGHKFLRIRKYVHHSFYNT